MTVANILLTFIYQFETKVCCRTNTNNNNYFDIKKQEKMTIIKLLL